MAEEPTHAPSLEALNESLRAAYALLLEDIMDYIEAEGLSPKDHQRLAGTLDSIRYALTLLARPQGTAHPSDTFDA